MRETISTSTYQRLLENFGGLDCTGDTYGVANNRFVRMDNLWRDYRAGEGNAIETFPGYRCLTRFSEAIHGVFYWRCTRGSYLVVHTGRDLRVIEFSETDGTALTKEPSTVTGGTGVMSEQASTAFSWMEALDLLDGAHYFVLKSTDGAFTLSEVRDLYIPVTYSDGEAYEQRNMLSDRAVTRYRVGLPASFSYATPKLRYTVLDPVTCTCEVSGIERPSEEKEIYIPAYTQIGSKTYTVTRIGWKAFSQINTIEELYVSEGVESIATAAFDCCRGLKTVALPDSLREIGAIAFNKCPLEKIILGNCLTDIARGNFTGSTPTIVYHGSSDDFAERVTVSEENNAGFSTSHFTYADNYPLQVTSFTLYDPVKSIRQIRLEGEVVTGEDGSIRAYPIKGETYIEGVLLRCEDGQDVTDKVLEVECELDPAAFTAVEGQTDFAAANPGYDGTAITALARCTVAAVYDGRVFLSGNPAFPNTVFYTSRDLTGQINPAYVGVLNYFQNGVGSNPNTALLPTSSYLAVLKEEPTGSGAVFYYSGSDTGESLLPRIYVQSDSVAGRGCIGVAVNFVDDPVFLSEGGVEALSKQALNTERSIKHRSTLIDPALLSHGTEKPLAAVWDGYLVLLYSDGEAYLADSRRTCTTLMGTEYEWYHLSGVGAYSDDLCVYRYAGSYPDGGAPCFSYAGESVTAELYPTPEALPYEVSYEEYPNIYEKIYSGSDEEGNPVFFTVEEDEGGRHFYLLYATPERTGGTFSAPRALLTCEGKLLFGCENGALCVVNTDRRGMGGYTPGAEDALEESAADGGLSIRSDWYSFAGHRIISGFVTAPDDCGVPNYTKKTVRRSTVAEMKAGAGCGFRFRVSINRGTYLTHTDSIPFEGGVLDFTEVDYSRFVFGDGESNTAVLQERTKRWVSKQYRVYSDVYAEPFGIYRISYSYRIEGKVKNR
jgi:hypothetical protein